MKLKGSGGLARIQIKTIFDELLLFIFFIFFLHFLFSDQFRPFPWLALCHIRIFIFHVSLYSITRVSAQPSFLHYKYREKSEDRKHISLNSTIYRLHTLFLDSGWTLLLGVRKILPQVTQLPRQLMHDFFEDHWVHILPQHVEEEPVTHVRLFDDGVDDFPPDESEPDVE